jgi:hypothetical protein
MAYDPPRRRMPKSTGDPLEVELVFGVRPCGTCNFFWPTDPSKQPYGPYPAYDFDTNTPATRPPGPSSTYAWVNGTTRSGCFPDAEIMDGCRKAPIMTIGINPNLTAFAPGRTGTGWAYPNFADDDEHDAFTKYAYYYRYRSVYQERLDPAFVERFLLPAPRVVASRAGSVVSAERPTSSPSYELKVRYEGDSVDTVISLDGELGRPRWVLLVDTAGDGSTFAAGDVLAAQLEIPEGQTVQLYRDQVGYYEQFVPVLQGFEAHLRAKGAPDPALRMGEDVCQLDMVACASPHWNPGFLGGTPQSEQSVINNCVSVNGWAIKQLVHTRPAVLYLVGEPTYAMFAGALGGAIERDPPLSSAPADGAFTLLRESTDPAHPCTLHIAVSVDGTAYELETRLVVTPHFSYSTNFMAQFRLAPEQWQALQASDPACATFLQTDPRLTFTPPVKPTDFAAFLITGDDRSVAADLAARFSISAAVLEAGFFDPHAMMGAVLAELYDSGGLVYGKLADGSSGLARTEGSCRFCVNDRWQFPLGCPYGKPDEPPPPPGFLEQVAAQAIRSGQATTNGGAR